MRELIIGCLAWAGCGMAPATLAAPRPEPDVVVATPRPEPDVAAATPRPVIAPGVLDPENTTVSPGLTAVTRAIRIDGLARFDRIAFVGGPGMFCGTRAGHAPVCAMDPQHVHAYERFHDVAVVQALGSAVNSPLGAIHCVLFGSGVLECHREGPWEIIARGVAGFEIGSTPKHGDVVFALGRDRALRIVIPGKPNAEPHPIATSVRGMASFGTGGVCAVLESGRVACSDPKSADPRLVATPIEGATSVFYGGAALRTDGTWTFAADNGMLPAYAPLPPSATDYAPAGICVIVRGGTVQCGGLGRGWIDVVLPAPARSFGPRGDASCAQLVDGSTACWGAFLEELVRLGARSTTTTLAR